MKVQNAMLPKQYVIYILTISMYFEITICGNNVHYNSLVEIDFQQQTLLNTFYFKFVLNNRKEIFNDKKRNYNLNKDLSILNHFMVRIYCDNLNIYDDKTFKKTLYSLHDNKIEAVAFDTLNLPVFITYKVIYRSSDTNKIKQTIIEALQKIRKIVSMMFRIEKHILKANISFLEFIQQTENFNNLIKSELEIFITKLNTNQNNNKEKGDKKPLEIFSLYLKEKPKEHNHSIVNFLIEQYNILLGYIKSIRERSDVFLKQTIGYVKKYQNDIDLLELRNFSSKPFFTDPTDEKGMEILINILYEINKTIAIDFEEFDDYMIKYKEKRDVNIYRALQIFHKLKRTILNAILKNYFVFVDVVFNGLYKRYSKIQNIPKEQIKRLKDNIKSNVFDIILNLSILLKCKEVSELINEMENPNKY
eukprot:GAHX01002093.1.p1 GENE.GAHX01002093.1~~GAHX01002093.1.p1  ORF type:complete len:419 (+),score=94.84 GAHX01002093.1:475-1731(+)